MASPRYSETSNGPMAFTIQSYLIADARVMTLPASNAHQAHVSPRRNAVTAMALATIPNATLKTPYIRNTTSMYRAVAGSVLASSDQEPPVKPSYPAVMIGVPLGPSR